RIQIAREFEIAKSENRIPDFPELARRFDVSVRTLKKYFKFYDEHGRQAVINIRDGPHIRRDAGLAGPSPIDIASPASWLSLPVKLIDIMDGSYVTSNAGDSLTPQVTCVDFAEEQQPYQLVEASSLLAWMQDETLNNIHENEACFEYSGCTRAQHRGRG